MGNIEDRGKSSEIGGKDEIIIWDRERSRRGEMTFRSDIGGKDENW